MVRAPARNHPGAKLFHPQPARPVESAGRHRPVQRVVHLRRRAQPGIVLEACRHRHLLRITSCRITRQADLHPLHLADPPVAYQLARPGKLLPRPLLRADLQNLLGRVDVRHHRPPLNDRQRSRLLQVNVLTRAHRRNGQPCMLVVGRRNHHSIDVFGRQQLTIVVVAARSGVGFAEAFGVLPIDERNSLLYPWRVQVAHRDDAVVTRSCNPGVLQHTRHIVHARDASHADRADVDPVRRRILPQHRRRHNARKSHSCGGTRRDLQKVTARNALCLRHALFKFTHLPPRP